MKRYYNKTAVLDSIGLFFLSGTIIYLLISKRIRELTSPSTDIFMIFAAIALIIWAIYILRNIKVWKRKVNYGFFGILSITSILLIVPHNIISAGGIVSENANYNITSNQNLTFGTGGMPYGDINTDTDIYDNSLNNTDSDNIGLDNNPSTISQSDLSDNKNSNGEASSGSSFSIREVSDKEAKEILDKNAKANLEQSKKVKESLGLLDSSGNDNANSATNDSNIDITGKIETIMPSGKKIILNGYDIAKKSITVSSEEFYPWLNEIFINPEKYDGYKITISGIFWRESDMDKDQFLLSRYLITCCVADASNAGILAAGEIENLNEGDWIKVDGTIILSNSTFQQTNKLMPYLKITSIENIEPESNPYIYYSEY